MASDPNATQADIDATVVENSTGAITPTGLHRLFTALNSVLIGAFVVVGGIAYLNPAAIAPGSITADKLAPGVVNGSALASRVVAGSAPVAMLVTDGMLVLNGPTEVDLEKKPPLGTTHIVKQGAAAGAPAILLVAAAGDTIDGGPSITFPPSAAKPALAMSFTAAGWEAY